MNTDLETQIENYRKIGLADTAIKDKLLDMGFRKKDVESALGTSRAIPISSATNEMDAKKTDSSSVRKAVKDQAEPQGSWRLGYDDSFAPFIAIMISLVFPLAGFIAAVVLIRMEKTDTKKRWWYTAALIVSIVMLLRTSLMNIIRLLL